MMTDRLITAESVTDDEAIERALRPKRLVDYVGQPAVVEQMEDACTGQAHTAHTTEPVPFIYVGKRNVKVREGGVLADVAPTMLKLLGLAQPAEMTGTSILIDA